MAVTATAPLLSYSITGSITDANIGANTDTNNETQNLSQMLSRPLITGASLSADRSATSPGKRLALRYTRPDQIRTLAYGGRPGRDVINMLPEKVLEDRSAVIAIDMFFWDSTLSSLDSTVKSLNHLMSQVKKQNIPIIFGEVPELLPGFQPQVKKLNKILQQTCRSYGKCYLMPFVDLHAKILRDSFVLIEGRKYSLHELVPDGLHLSAKASDYLADMMKSLLLKKTIKL